MRIKRMSTIIISFIIAICLSILPLPDWANWLRPAWVALVLLYWIITLPASVSVGAAWILGLFMDVINGTPLGEHALAFTLVAYMGARGAQQLGHYPLWQQATFIMLCMLVYHLALYIMQWIMGQVITDWRYWVSPFISMLLWPWLSLLLQKYQRRLQVV